MMSLSASQWRGEGWPGTAFGGAGKSLLYAAGFPLRLQASCSSLTAGDSNLLY